MAAAASVLDELNAYLGSGDHDPYPILAEKRRETPVMEGDIGLLLGAPSPSALHDGPVYTYLRYRDVRSAFLDKATYSSAIWRQSQAPFLGETLLAMDGDAHRMWRGLLTDVFNPRALAGWEAHTLQPIAAALVGELKGKGRADLTEYAFRFPIRAIYEVIGLGAEDSYEQFSQLALEMLFIVAINPDEPELTQRNLARAMKATKVSLELLLPVVARKRAQGAPDNDLICHLINAEFEGRTLTDEEIATFVRSIFLPSTESTTRMFLNIMTTLLKRPDVLERIREDRSLLMPAIMECERYEPVALQIPRVTTREVEVGGVTIPEGAGVMLCISSANRDEEVYPDPDDFRLDREGPPSMTFGFGSHMCVGMQTSRRELVAMISAVLDELPGLRLDPDAAPPVIRGTAMRSPNALDVVWD